MEAGAGVKLTVSFKGKPISEPTVQMLNLLYARANKDLDVSRFGQACVELGIEVRYPAPATITKRTT